MTRIITTPNVHKAWWKSAVVYQIYPSSFQDSNGDGVGDIPGIISRIPYLQALGVDVVWLSPIFASPQVDMGYDVSDYTAIHPPYGTVGDVERLARELHSRGMRLLQDLVVNHTSDEHAWFADSRSSRTAAKRDWYIWREGVVVDGVRGPPNNWKTSLGGGSVWEWDEATQEYYLHYYDVKMPDLNWENAEVREAVYDVMRFWIDKGCDGFRMDVIGRISKDLTFPNAPVTDPASPWQDTPRYEGPRVHEFIHEMNRKVLSQHDIMTVGELSQTTSEQMLRFVHPDRQELQMGFCFDHVNLGRGGLDNAMVAPHTLPQLKAILAEWQGLREKGGWHALYLENHDQPRSISRYANDTKYRWQSAKLLALMHCTMWGTVFLHQGQELGMINLPSDWPLEDFKDCKTQNVVRKLRARGGSSDEIGALTRSVYHKARDNGRSPMQWDGDSPYAGFSTCKPWMRIPDDYRTCNAAEQQSRDDSTWSFWRAMIALRKGIDDLVYGSFEHLDPEHEQVFCYVRAGIYLVVLNFSPGRIDYTPPVPLVGARVVMETDRASVGESVGLEPYSGVLLRLLE